jgi:DNA ligase (NAD+)
MTKTSAKKRIAKLRQEIRHHSYLYHVLDKQEISDAAWDSLKAELAKLEQQFPEFITPDSPSQRVSGRRLDKFQKVRHRVRQWSLNDVFTREEIGQWEERNLKILQKQIPKIKSFDLDYVCELKIDGLHIVLHYQGGLLKTAATRGDGVIGEDVTLNIKTIGSIPLKLRQSVNIVVEGEVWMSKSEFQRLNKECIRNNQQPFANPRNAAAGSIRQLDPSITASRKLDSFVYDWVWPERQIPDTQFKELRGLRKLGFKVEPHFKLCKNLKEVGAFLRYWSKHHDKLSYLVDGVVIKLNKQKYQKVLGYTGKAPRFSIAFKFPAEEATTTILDIRVQIGRLGRLTPVAYLKPVLIAGSTVSRATLHNQAFIDNLDARVLDTVIIRKAGDIIPEVIKVLPRLRPKKAVRFKMPGACPVCASLVKIDDSGGSVLHFCPNTKCGARNYGQIKHFVGKRAFNIDGLGGKIIGRFLGQGLISDAADIFTLKKGDIEVLENFGKKSAQNLMDSIEHSKKIDLSKFLYALGIPHIGERMAQNLAKFIVKRFGKVRVQELALKLEQKIDLEQIPDFGPKAAKSIKNWFADKRNQNLLAKLDQAGVKIIYPRTAPGRRLANKIFVLTGSLRSLTRDQAKDLVVEQGGQVSSSVSKNTDYVVAGRAPGLKYKKAKTLGIKIIREKEFLRLVRR